MPLSIISWNDVAYYLGQLWTNPDTTPPDAILSYDVYPDQLTITVRSETATTAAKEWLSEHLGGNYSDNTILMQSPDTHLRSLPVEIMVDEDEERLNIDPVPRFSRMGLISSKKGNWLPKPFEPDQPEIFSFYSFKGGVGRTLSLIAFVKAMSEKYPDRKFLIVDADLEAPGLTSLCSGPRDKFPRFSLSLTDLLAMAHADQTEGWKESIQTAKGFIETSPISFDAGDHQVEHYFLPAYREKWQQLYANIRPEHLIQSGDPWGLTQLFASLGKSLGVYAVVIDLRAGISEMTSPFLFDPRGRRFLVSSCSQQSLDGISLILGELSKLPLDTAAGNYYDPEIVLTFVTEQLENLEITWLEEQEEFLRDQYRPDIGEATLEALERLTITRTPFEGQLLNLRNWSEALKALEGTQTAKMWTHSSKSYDTEMTVPEPSDLNKTRQALHDSAKMLVFAESIKDMKYLRIPPLRNLARKFKQHIPIANVIGSKGSGKTFTSLILASAGTWEKFVHKTLGEEIEQKNPDPDQTPIWPLLYSGNLKQESKIMLNRNKTEATNQLDLTSTPHSLDNLIDRIREKQKENPDLTAWRKFWFELIAFSLNLHIQEGDPEEQTIRWFILNQKRLVVTVDGLEEIFDQVDQNQSMALALRALIEGVPRRLQEIPNCPLGILIFVRSDLVRLAISQNVGQFESQYEDFKLVWNRQECLRLVLWICNLSECIFEENFANQIHTLSEKKMNELLLPIWGKKLGTERSNEAYTTPWIIASLSDFRAQIQARDMVRFLMYASEISKDDAYHGRLLVPNAIRRSIGKCSVDKVEEIRREFPELQSVFKKIDSTHEDKRLSPFKPEALGFTESEIETMENLGIVLKDRGLFYFPEIYLYGFKFTYSRRGRNRVLSLFRKIVK